MIPGTTLHSPVRRYDVARFHLRWAYVICCSDTLLRFLITFVDYPTTPTLRFGPIYCCDSPLRIRYVRFYVVPTTLFPLTTITSHTLRCLPTVHLLFLLPYVRWSWVISRWNSFTVITVAVVHYRFAFTSTFTLGRFPVTSRFVTTILLPFVVAFTLHDSHAHTVLHHFYLYDVRTCCDLTFYFAISSYYYIHLRYSTFTLR